MKKVVLILDGIVAKKFLQIVLEKYFSNNTYIVVSSDASMIPDEIPSSFHFHIFDPTSSFRLLNSIQSDVGDVFILIQDSKERSVVYDIIRSNCKDVRIIIDLPDDREISYYNHEKTDIIDESAFVSSAIISRLPNVPLIPQDFGLGIGEVMEIGIPFGSPFAYRHVGSIQQKDYRIVGIYRQNEFLLSNYSLVIQPTDALLVAGDPNTLTNVYRQVKSNIGQFPAPFGKDIYVYVDMILQEFDELMHDIYQAVFLHAHLRSTKLYIHVFRPNDIETMREIKALDNSDIEVFFNYAQDDFIEMLKIHLKKKIGLLVLGKKLFLKRKVRKILFASGVPVFKTSYKDIADARSSLVVLNEDMNEGENISSVIFDISMQMDLEVMVYDFDPDRKHQDEILQDYQDLARAYDIKVQVQKTNTKNPILYLRGHKKPILHFLPFERCITGRRIFNYISTKVERISFMFDDHPQIFIPILDQNDER
ncbi:COG3400 family protein [Helicobacter mustelae]|uniref:COG3400 family protein n=1 Tax=Helicobacter mustelae TaxID=217 RepID=UPI0003214920|nr:TrkA C-terminal domain-containing protein [Helicobacter mustelae]